MNARVTSKKFQFTNDLRWNFDRIGEVEGQGKPPFRISSPVEFRGEAGHWTPEDLFVASANGCLMLTFLSAAEKEHIAVSGYESSATGTLERIGNEFRFSEITIEPVVSLQDSGAASRIEELLHEAEKNCLIGNSMKAVLQVRPRVLAIAD